MTFKLCLVCVTLVIQCFFVQEATLFVIPEDVGTAFAAIYGFSPRIILGRDHRVGFGFRLGNHADFQILYELGPQTTTKALKTTQIRSAVYEKRARRRPFLELLVRAGVLLEHSDHKDKSR